MSAAGRLIHVAVGVLRDGRGRVLLTRRPEQAHQGGLWEFPGGKLQSGEPVERALRRELAEELGIRVRSARPLIRIRYPYPERTVLLDTWVIERFDGVPTGCEGQPLAWVRVTEFDDYPLPAADRPIVTALRLPEVCPVTDGSDLPGFGRGTGGDGCFDLPIARDGETGAPIRLRGRLCHADDAPRALSAGDVDFALLGPVRRAAGEPGLDWAGFREAVDPVNVPVYAWGRLRPADLVTSWRHGAQGIVLGRDNDRGGDPEAL